MLKLRRIKLTVNLREFGIITYQYHSEDIGTDAFCDFIFTFSIWPRETVLTCSTEHSEKTHLVRYDLKNNSASS